MNIEIKGPVNRERWLASLFAKGASSDAKGEAEERLAADLKNAEGLLLAAARPKAVYKFVSKDILIPSEEGGSQDVKGSVSIKRHLAECDKAVLMAVTLGVGVDELIRRTQITDMATAVIIDAGASVLVEQAADELSKEISRKISETAEDTVNVHMTPRFSPGYGDWPITEQSRIVRILDASKQIGLNVTKDSLMVPRKSITAVIGIADHPVSGALATCNECVMKDKCELRKEGKFCGDKL